MARQFICPFCCTLYNGTLPLEAWTTCDNCCERFKVWPFLGDQNSMLRALTSGIFGLIAGMKCPNCGIRDSSHLRDVDCGQIAISGRWHSSWDSFYLCNKCRGTWYYGETREAWHKHVHRSNEPVRLPRSASAVHVGR